MVGFQLALFDEVDWLYLLSQLELFARIIGLDGLRGPLPTEIQYLWKLKKLDLGTKREEQG